MNSQLKRFTLVFLSIIFTQVACKQTEKADMLIHGGKIYTADSKQPSVEAIAVSNGKILFAGAWDEAENYQGDKTEIIDLEGKTLIPGFIESHAHFMGLGRTKRMLDLTKIRNYKEMVEMVAEAVKNAQPGEWILGRGWHQSKWDPQPDPLVTGYQTHEAMSAISPDNPVFLTHASGHASFANAKAMEIAGITPGMNFGEEGEIIQYPDGKPTGVFTEAAEGLIQKHIPDATKESLEKDLEAAIQECLANGITSFHDAGAGQQTIDLLQAFEQADKLHVRLWVMLNGGERELLQDWYEKGPLVGDQLSVGGIKLYSDGALGSRGAWLLDEYEDRKNHYGNPIMPMDYIHQVAQEGLKYGFQVCVHAIGDRANREVLNQYARAFKANPEAAKDHRFRIEHAQHLHPEDIPRFSQLGVIASMQGIHMSSDRPWAIDRLGRLRIIQGAYMWQQLIQSGAKVINGTDAPVEPVNPIACFYASVTRQTLAGKPEGGYEPDQKMTREQALRSYTLDAAYGAFEEKKKGSIAVGKLADFTVLSQDIMEVPDDQILDTKVLMTIIGGEIKYRQ